MTAPFGIHRMSTSAMSTITRTPKETPVASAKKSLANLKQRVVGPLPIEYLPAEPIKPPKLRTNRSMPALRDKTSISRLQPEEDEDDEDLFQACPLPLSPRGEFDAKNVADGPRFMSMEEAGEVNGTQVIPRSKHYVVRVKMPTVWGVPPSRKKRRRKAPPRDPRPLRIAKALKRQPEVFKNKCKGAFRGFVQKAMQKRLNGCVRALQAEVVEEQEYQEEQQEENEEESEEEIIELKPIYRLRERKRQSLRQNLARPDRPLSFASVLTASSDGNRRRYSDISVYSTRMSTAGLPSESLDNATSSCEADNGENSSRRVSLASFREWLSFMYPHNNPFTDTSSTSTTDERPLSLSSTRTFSASNQEASSIHNEEDPFHSLFILPSSSSSTRPTSQILSLSTLFRNSPSYFDSSEITDESQALPPSPTSSELTITPLRFSHARNMSKDLHGSSKDPVTESMDSKAELKDDTGQVQHDIKQENDATQAENCDDPNAMAVQEATLPSFYSEQHDNTRVSPKGDLAFEGTRVVSDKLSESKGSVPSSHPENHKLQNSELSSKGDSNENKSQLPRTTGNKSYPGLGKGIRAIPEYRSAIPVPVNRQGSGSGGETPPSSFNEGNHVGVRSARTYEVHSGPPRPWSPEPIREAGRESQSSSPSVSDYGSDDVEFVMQKPKAVFTGEYRTRSDRFRASSYGPTLKIASSADDVIMGPAAKTTPVSSSANVKDVEKVQADSSQDTGLTPKGKSIPVHDNQSASPKTERSHGSGPSGHLPKRDISNREMTVPRKPLSRPSLNNLFAASASSPTVDDTPPVPKVPASTEGVVQKSSPLSGVEMADSSTQTRSPQRERAALGMTPEQISSMLIPLRAHLPPPRTSSLQALTGMSLYEENEAAPRTPEQSQDQEDNPKPQHPQAEYSRLPESKSYRMLDGFRSMFKQRGAGEKTRSKQDESEQSVELLPKEQSIISVKSIDTTDNKKTETPKPAPKKVGWNKVTRNPRLSTRNSPAGSSPLSISSPLSASVNNRPLEIHTPSFARPTQSTRTKYNSNVTGTTAAGVGSKPPPTSQEGQPRRVIQSVAASTGSPQRPFRTGVKRPASSGNKRPTISSPRPIASEPDQDKTTPRSGDLKKPEPVKASFKDIHTCIAKLCNKARDEGTADEREKYLRLALALQQQVSDFNNSEKEAGEAHMIFNSKKFEKDAAHNTLFEYFAQVQAQLNEE